MFDPIRIRQHERGLWFRHGDFAGLLPPGQYRFWSRLASTKRDTVEVVDTLATQFNHKLLDVLLANPMLRGELEVVDLADTQRAAVWKDGRLWAMLGPGRHAFWKQPHELRIEVFDTAELRVQHPKLATLVRHPGAAAWLEAIQVAAGTVALMFRDGVLVDTLREGQHVFWRKVSELAFRVVDLREQVADVAGQEIITADKVTLRVNLVVVYQVADAVKAVTAVGDFAQALYREAQLVLRAAVGTRLLDALLADKEAVAGEVRAALAARAAELGLAVISVGLRDIVLPGDMKTLLNQVIAASKEAEANLIRRREETAAARSQANTARLLAENPALARVKELELLAGILAGAKATFVFGPGDLAGQVRSLVAADTPAQP